WFDNEEVGQAPGLIQRKVGYMPDFFGVYPDLTAVEYLEFYAGIHAISGKKRANTIKDLLELVDLSSKGETPVETLSRGMKQRLCLARALVHDPEVLLLDEPASGLDPRARVELRELLRTLQGMGKTIIISSHILLEMAEMCTDVAIIQAGSLVMAGDVEQISRRGKGRQLEIRVLEGVPEAIALLKGMPDVADAVNGSSEGMSHDKSGGAINLASTDKSPLYIIQVEFTGDDRALQSVLAKLVTEGIPVVSF